MTGVEIDENTKATLATLKLLSMDKKTVTMPESLIGKWKAKDGKKGQWTTMDDMFEDMIKGSKLTFQIIANINIILVGLGIFLIVYAMVYSALRGTELASIITGVGGLGVIVTNFFVAPQTHISQSLGDKGQIQMIYKTYYTQSELLRAFIEQNSPLPLDKTLILLDILQNYTEKSVKLIEECMGPKQPSEVKTTFGS